MAGSVTPKCAIPGALKEVDFSFGMDCNEGVTRLWGLKLRVVSILCNLFSRVRVSESSTSFVKLSSEQLKLVEPDITFELEFCSRAAEARFGESSKFD